MDNTKELEKLRNLKRILGFQELEIKTLKKELVSLGKKINLNLNKNTNKRKTYLLQIKSSHCKILKSEDELRN